ncbi:hypothetical protein LguiA_028921 [Lonicera macranthoides]
MENPATTLHHPPPPPMPPQNHLPSPQNHQPPPENYLPLISSSTHTQHQNQQLHTQNLIPMADFANFLQNMQDNQSKFQEQIVHLLQNNFPDPSVPQQQHNPVHSRYTAVSADSAANMQVQGNFPVQSAEPGTLMIQTCPHTSNTILRTPKATPSLLAAPGILSPSNGIFFSQIDSFPVHTGPTCSDQFWTCPQVSYTSLVLPTPVTPLPSAPSNFPLPKTPFLGHFSCNNSSSADLGNNGRLIQALQPQGCPQASSCSEGKLVGVSTTESAFSAEIRLFFNSSTEQQSVQANSVVQSSPQSINISQRISEQVLTSPVGQNNFSHIETSSSATISGFSANSDHEMARQLHQQQKGDFYLPSNSSLGMVTQLSENNPFVASPKTCILGDNNNFSFPLLHHTQESPAVLDPHFINGNNTTCGIPEAQIQYLSPIVFSQQNSLLPNSTNALTALCNVTGKVQTFHPFPDGSVSAGAHSSRTAFTQQNTHPITSQNPFHVSLPCSQSVPHQPSPFQTLCQPNNIVETPPPPLSTFLVPFELIFLLPELSQPSFASLFQHNKSSTPVPLAPLPIPYSKGNLPAIKLDEHVYQKSIIACQFNLIGRLSLPKGSPPTTTFDLHAKLQSIWKLKNQFILTPVGRGFFCLRFKGTEDQNHALLAGQLNLNPGSFRLQPWIKDFNPHNQKSTTCNVWIRLHDVAQDYWDPHILISIASLVGIPQAIDKNTLHFTFGHYARLKVEVDMLHPQPSKLLVEREGFSFEVPVTYENLPNFCSYCLSLGHSVGECRALKNTQVNLPKVKNNRAAKQPHAPKNQQAATDPVHIIGNSAANLPIASNALHAPIPQHITPLIVTEQASPPAHQCHDMKPFEPHNIQLSSASLHSSSKETVVPCSFSPKKNKTDFKSKNHSTSFYKQNTPTPSINRSLSISNNTFKNKILFQNQFDPISDLHWEDDGEGENWNCLGSSEDDDNSSMGGYSPVGPTHFRDVPKLNVYEALNWSSMAEEEPLKSMEALADDQFAAALNHHNQNAGAGECIQLLQDTNSSILNQNFPPLDSSLSPPSIKHKTQPSPSTNDSPSSGSPYTPSPTSKIQKTKKASNPPLHKQKKLSKAAKREANALSRLSKSSTKLSQHNPDEYQWNLLLADQQKKQNASTSVLNVVENSDALQNRAGQAAPDVTHVNEGWKVTIHPQHQPIKANSTNKEDNSAELHPAGNG